MCVHSYENLPPCLPPFKYSLAINIYMCSVVIRILLEIELINGKIFFIPIRVQVIFLD